MGEKWVSQTDDGEKFQNDFCAYLVPISENSDGCKLMSPRVTTHRLNKIDTDR